MKEIGGYFGLEDSHGNGEYYSNLIALNTARNALAYICKARKISKLYIPYFMCDTATFICKRENIAFEYYHVGYDFKPILDLNLKNNEYLYIVNYYGQLSKNEIFVLKNKFKRIILDNVQAFFQEPLDGIDTIYSCRKFFGVPDGAYLATNCFLREELIVDNSSITRMAHIYGRSQDGASAHYSEYQKAEASLYGEPLKFMSNITHRLLKNIDYDIVKKKREQNFAFLNNALSEINSIRIVNPEGPYMYPLYLKDGDLIRKKLALKKIYIPTLWPNVEYGHEFEMAHNLLPIPCDQRYSIDDMEIIYKEIMECIN